MLEWFPVSSISNSSPYPDRSEYGDTKGCYTTHALIDILQPLYKALDTPGACVRFLLIDFSKVFDHIDHSILLIKLEHNNIDPVLVDWFHGFLSKRQQWLKISSKLSSRCTLYGGVPQGSISGPELFKHMVSDFHTIFTDYKFGDDSTLVETCKRETPSKM